MDYSILLPREKHAAFRWLGKVDGAFTIKDGGEVRTTDVLGREIISGRSIWVVNEHRIAGTDGWKHHAQTLMPILNMCKKPGMNILGSALDAHGAALARGPKLFRPTEEQFEAMQHVEINVPISDYRQPYPALLVEIPKEIRRALLKTAPEIGQVMVLRQTQTADGKVCVVILNGEWTYVFQDRECLPTVEAAIGIHHLDPSKPPSMEMLAHVTSMVCARAALNLAMMLTHYGSRIAGPLEPANYQKHRSSQKFERLCHGDFMAVEMKQSIVVRDVRGAPSDHEPCPTGREMPPHWRSGHWRNQPHGAGNALRKLVFIRPKLIRADRVVGDVADSEVVLTGAL